MGGRGGGGGGGGGCVDMKATVLDSPGRELATTFRDFGNLLF